jgi:uncharacterized protein YbjT (DUF2867 family)
MARPIDNDKAATRRRCLVGRGHQPNDRLGHRPLRADGRGASAAPSGDRTNVIALTQDGHDAATYRVSGPEQLLPAEQLAILAAALGRDLTWESQTLEETRADLQAQMASEYVDAFFAFYVDGLIDETTVQPDAERVLGRPPRRFADWARRQAGDFASS